MRFLVNPVKSVRYKGRAVSKGKWKASGFTRNAPAKKPTARQLAARKKFTAMAKARAVAARKSTRAQPGVTPMAKARKRKAAHRRKGVRRVARSRSRARRTVYAANPRRRRRRTVARAGGRRTRRYRRNPGFSMSGAKGALMTLGMGVGGALGGMALGNFITNNVTPKIFAPAAGDTPQSVALRNAAIVGLGALGVLMFGKKMAPPLVVYSVAVGMMVVPVKNLIYASAPAGSPFTFLGGSSVAMPPFRRPNGLIAPARRSIGSYPRQAGRGGVAAYPQMGAYPAATYSQVQPN